MTKIQAVVGAKGFYTEANYPATITEVHTGQLQGMITIKLRSGYTCIPIKWLNDRPIESTPIFEPTRPEHISDLQTIAERHK